MRYLVPLSYLPRPLSVVCDSPTHDPLLPHKPPPANVLVIRVRRESVKIPLSLSPLSFVKGGERVALERGD
jgi:hypothetical protein